MSNLLKYLLAFFILQSVISGCRSTKRTGAEEIKERKSSYILKRMDRASFQANWFSAKAKVTILYDGQRLGASMNFKIQKDTVIWANLKKLGIELGRLKITTDSIQIIDRINKRFIAKRIDELSSTYGFPANFKTIQDVLFGNAFFWNQEELSSSVKKSEYILSCTEGRQNSTHFVDAINYLLNKQYLLDDELKWELESSYQGYGASEFPNFSYIRNIKVMQPEEVDLTLTFSKITINQAERINFNIPAHYQPLRLE